jgi:hypothetical protein
MADAGSIIVGGSIGQLGNLRRELGCSRQRSLWPRRIVQLPSEPTPIMCAMAVLRPAVFIGSSSEGLGVAKALQVLVDRSADCEPWNQGTFGSSAGALESLVSALHRFDFADAVGRIA